jgi:MSHA biogenesis protein MshQ
MRTILSRISMALTLVGLVALVTSNLSAAECTNTTTLAAGSSVRDICSSAAFTSGANSTVSGNISAKAAVTLGATSKVNGSVTAGADFTSGDSSVVSGNVSATGDITLGANSRITGSVHSGTGVITYGAGATVGKVVK